MTTQESLLALAKAVYPDVDWLAHAYPQGVTGTPNRGEHPYNHVYIRFDPANNSEQAMEVLCWLTTRNEFRSIGRKNVNFTKMVMARVDQDGRHALRPGLQSISHDNTPASLRAAIVQAACVVVSA